MTIAPINSAALQPNQPATGSPSANAPGFAEMLANAVDQANQLGQQADMLAASYAAGGPVSIDQLMMAEQKASLAVDLVVQVRNRVVSAYQSLMNMQI